MTYARASMMWQGRQVHPGDSLNTKGIDESRLASMTRLRLITSDPDDVPIGRTHSKPKAKTVAELRAEAEELGLEHIGLGKAELRELLAQHREETD